MQDQTKLSAAKAAAPYSTPFQRRSLLKAALGGAAVLGAGPLLAACGSDEQPSGGNAGGSPATVRMWTWYG